MRVNVDVHMAVAVMLVLVGMDLVFKGFAQASNADAEQHHPHQALAPGREQFDRQQVAQPQ